MGALGVAAMTAKHELSPYDDDYVPSQKNAPQ